MTECSVLDLKQKIERQDVLLIDVREAVEFAGSRIAEAKLIPLGSIEQRRDEIDPTRPIYVICRTGRRSAEAQKRLNAVGFTDVTNVAGGIEAWKKQKLPVVRDEHAPWSIERQVRFTAGLLVFTGVILSLLVHPYFVALSGLVGFGLAFTAMIDWCGMGLLIARMSWNKSRVV